MKRKEDDPQAHFTVKEFSFMNFIVYKMSRLLKLYMTPSLSFILWFLRRQIIEIPPTILQNCRPTGTTPLHPTIPAYKEKAVPPLCTYKPLTSLLLTLIKKPLSLSLWPFKFQTFPNIFPSFITSSRP